jgi:large subunit ribosomal protein L30
MLGVLRIRGDVDVRHDVRKTFDILKLDRKFTLSVVKDEPSSRGMIKLINDHVTWGEISKEALKALEKVKSKGENIKVFRLHPPRGGFKKSIKKPMPKGELGYRGDKINALVLRMLP